MSADVLDRVEHELLAAGDSNDINPPPRSLSQEGDEGDQYWASLQMLSGLAIAGEDPGFADVIASSYSPEELTVILATGSTALSAEISAPDFLDA